MQERDAGKNSVKREIGILFLLFVLSIVSVFGIYNTFTANLFDVIGSIPDDTERYANYAIMAAFALTMGSLQGINLKKRDLFGKLSVILGIIAAIAVILAIILFFTKSLLYPLLTFVVVGTTMYMLELVFVTIGTKGFFFFVVLFGLAVIGLYRLGYREAGFLVTVSELLLAALLFIAATYPRIKALLLHIGTRDNVDIENTGGGEIDDGND